jgi:ribosome-binding protein aMBF1 (putative translation factor)
MMAQQSAATTAPNHSFGRGAKRQIKRLVARASDNQADALETLEKVLASRIGVASAVIAGRAAKRWTQQELAKQAGLKQALVSEIESLRGNPRLETLDKVARVLNLQVALVQRVSFPNLISDDEGGRKPVR